MESAAQSSADRFGDAFGGERMWGLKELPYPEPIPFTPETIGWLILAGLLLAVFIWMVWLARRRWQANAYRREALHELKRLPDADWSVLPFVLRKTALAAGGREAVASLRGPDWIQWLNDHARKRLFEPADANLLDAIAYGGQPPPAVELERLLNATRTWVSAHHA